MQQEVTDDGFNKISAIVQIVDKEVNYLETMIEEYIKFRVLPPLYLLETCQLNFDTIPEYLQVSALYMHNTWLGVKQNPKYGFAADYFCSRLHTLRNYNFERYIKQNLRFLEADKRDEQSIIKVASGMLKLLFPDGFYKKEELKMCDQLHLMDPEYKDKKITYEFR